MLPQLEHTVLLQDVTSGRDVSRVDLGEEIVLRLDDGADPVELCRFRELLPEIDVAGDRLLVAVESGVGGLLAGFDQLLVDDTVAIGSLAEALGNVIDLLDVVVVAIMVSPWLSVTTQSMLAKKC